jgi:hypothetical protein
MVVAFVMQFNDADTVDIVTLSNSFGRYDLHRNIGDVNESSIQWKCKNSCRYLNGCFVAKFTLKTLEYAV